MTNNFIHLHLHSEYSLENGLIRINALVDKLQRDNIPAVAITDQGNLFAAIKFYQAAQKKGIKPIIGAELRIYESGYNKDSSQLVLLCKNIEGYKNLNYLITKSYQAGQIGGMAYVKKDWLDGKSRGLIALSGAQKGDVGQAISAANNRKAKSLLNDWKTFFPNHFYLEIQRVGKKGEENYIHSAIELATEMDLPVVASNDAHFLSAEDYEAHEARVCIHQGHILQDPRRPRLFTQNQYLRNQEEMQELFQDIPEAIENTFAIAKRCNLELTLGENYLPDFKVPDNFNQDSWLCHKAAKGLKNLIPLDDDEDYATVQEVYQQRLDDELDVIIKTNFSGYFLIVADFIQWAKENHIPVGPGRGSGAGSLVAYALEITQIDPIKYDLLFERFLNPERVSPPDFDIDFCIIGRDKVIEYVANRYGKNHVSQIITYGRMASRAVIRDAGRVLGYHYSFVDQIAKLIPHDLNMTLEWALKKEPMLQQRYQDETKVNTLIELARKLEGLARNAGRHAGGIVIAPTPLVNYMPLYYEKNSEWPVSQFDMDDVASIGLVKFDFLGLKTLTIIEESINEIKNKTNKLLNIENIPLDDNATYKLIKKTDTAAIFQLESDGMKKIIKRLKPDNFGELVALVALYRPGPLQSGMVDEYIDRKHGKSAIRYMDKRIEYILEPTYGIILYQEQVMQIAQTMADYTLGKADLLRRAMGKKKAEEMAKQREIFIEGSIKSGTKLTTANKIFDLMEKFAGYGFNKSHSVAYALIAYQTAWLKTHYSAYFMASVMSADMDNTDKIAILVEEIKNMGIKLEAPCINKSEYGFSVTDNNTIRYALGAIKGVGSAINNILEKRQEMPFKNIFDMCCRIDLKKINRRLLEALIKSGATDKLGPHRNFMICNMDNAMQFSEQIHRDADSGQNNLFGIDEHKTNKEVTIFEAKEWNDNELLEKEKEVLGFYFSGHPITKYEKELSTVINVKLKNISIKKNIMIAGYIYNIKRRLDKEGNKIAEIKLEDNTAYADAIIYAENFRKYHSLLEKNKFIIMRANIKKDKFYDSNYNIVAQEIYTLIQFREKAKLILHISQTDHNAVNFLKNTLTTSSKGNTGIIIKYSNAEGRCELSLDHSWDIAANDEIIDTLKNHFGPSKVHLEYNFR